MKIGADGSRKIMIGQGWDRKEIYSRVFLSC